MLTECQLMGLPVGILVKNLPVNVGDMGVIPGPGTFHTL